MVGLVQLALISILYASLLPWPFHLDEEAGSKVHKDLMHMELRIPEKSVCPSKAVYSSPIRSPLVLADVLLYNLSPGNLFLN